MGRLLAGLGPHEPSFADLPPHFIGGMEDEEISEFMYLCFGPIIRQYEEKLNITSCLLLLGASLVYHSDAFESIIANHPNHFFSRLPMYSDLHLLQRVKKLVTKEKTVRMTKPSGIPPHIKIMEMLRTLFGELALTNKRLDDIGRDITKAVQDGIESNDVRSGLLTLTTMESKLKEIGKDMMELIDKKLTASQGAIPTLEQLEKSPGPISTEFESTESACDIGPELEELVRKDTVDVFTKYYVYLNNGSFCDVPQDWTFPRRSLIDCWTMWCIGQPNNLMTTPSGIVVRAPVRPFALFRNSMLPKHLKNTFRSNFKPVFE